MEITCVGFSLGFDHFYICGYECSSQSAPLHESRKRSRDGPQQKRSRAIMALSFFNSRALKCLCYFNYNNFPITQNFQSKEQQLDTFLHNMKINQWIFFNRPTCYLIYHEWSGDHWTSTLEVKPGKRIFEVYRKFFFSRLRKSGWRWSSSEEAKRRRSWR